jgi:phytoene desaturase
MKTVPGRTDRVVVIGAGLGGLSAALHLAGAGREVTVLEREAEPGGRAGVLRDGGYTFDTGPTVITMPALIAEALGAVGENLDDWLDLRRLDPAYRAQFADGSSLDVLADTDAMASAIRSLCGPGDADGYRRLVAYLRELYELELPHFIARNLDSPLALLGRPLLELVRLGGFRRLAPKVGTFVRDERLRRLFTFQAMYAGLAPAQALAIYAVITYLDCVAGVYFPMGGVHAVPRALAGAADKHGVTFRYGTAATGIEVTAGRAVAVRTDAGERIPADVVVVNADAPTAYRELLGREPRRLRYSPSCVVLYAGVRGARPDAHHTISFGAAWQSTFDEIIRQGRVMSDPSFLLTTPTVTDPSLAPAGAHSQYVLFPAPNLDHGHPIDWAAEAPRYTEHMLATLAARGFDVDPEVRHLTTPADWGGPAGTPFAATHRFAQTGPFRLPTLDRRVANLVFCGSNVQPGVGVPMVLVSGRLAAQRIVGARLPSATIAT